MKFATCVIQNFDAKGIYMADQGYDTGGVKYDLYVYNCTIKDCLGQGIYLPIADSMRIWIGGFVYNFTYYYTTFDKNNINAAGGGTWSDAQLAINTAQDCDPGEAVTFLDGDFVKWIIAITPKQANTSVTTNLTIRIA